MRNSRYEASHENKVQSEQLLTISTFKPQLSFYGFCSVPATLQNYHYHNSVTRCCTRWAFGFGGGPWVPHLNVNTFVTWGIKQHGVKIINDGGVLCCKGFTSDGYTVFLYGFLRILQFLFFFYFSHYLLFFSLPAVMWCHLKHFNALCAQYKYLTWTQQFISAANKPLRLVPCHLRFQDSIKSGTCCAWCGVFPD